jgi:predicted nucleotidyltransferase
MLGRLVEHGVVLREEHRPASVYRFNREHLAARALTELARLRAALFERLRGVVAEWSPAAANVSLFGSAARGDGDTDSDIDILVVRYDDTAATDPAWTDQLLQTARLTERMTGNRVS